MPETEDPRSSRSRRALLDAVAALLDERDVAEISVTELVVAAGVSRPTFYQYFADVPAAAAAAAIEVLEEIFRASDARLERSDDAAFVRATIEALVHDLHARRAFFQRVLSGAPSYETLSSVVGLLRSRMRGRILGPRLVAEGSSDTAIDDRVTAVAAGTAWLGTRWLGSDFTGEDAPAAMVERLIAATAALQGIEVAR